MPSCKKHKIQIELFRQRKNKLNTSVWTKEIFLNMCRYVPLSNVQALKTWYQIYCMDKPIVNGANNCDAESYIDRNNEEVECEVIDVEDDGYNDEEVEANIVMW